MTSGPLSRFTVIDVSRVRAGPVAVRQLADWGATVIKVEPPAGMDDTDEMLGPRVGPDFQNLHRNKLSLTLNLKSEKGIGILKALAGKADVLVENYRPDVKTRLGIDYPALRALNPGLVYASISGFGQDGPYRNRPGFDQIAQGVGGLMSITGFPDQAPLRAGIPLADISAGLYCAMGVLVALLDREASGAGCWVQTSLIEAQVAMLDYQAARWLIKGEVPGRLGNEHPLTVPTGVFPTRDGHINIAATGQTMWVRLCKAIGAEHLLAVEAFSTNAGRVQHRREINAALAEIFTTQDSAHWLARLEAESVPCGPINTIDQVFRDPQVRHLGLAWPVTHPSLGAIELVGQPFRLSGQERAPTRPAPEKGQDTRWILNGLGITDEQVEALREERVI
ncbi:MAG TPA: CoA transferase [Azospirillum sp.]|nr:CoA transferase [Azospirillum sp.]